MFKRTCVVKYVDHFGIEHAAKLEDDSLFEAAIRGLLSVLCGNCRSDFVLNAISPPFPFRPLIAFIACPTGAWACSRGRPTSTTSSPESLTSFADTIDIARICGKGESTRGADALYGWTVE